MTPEQIDRVFGRGRLKMVTGEHVEVYREAVASGERRRYTKRFLDTREGDFGQWTEREWRILARLIGHGITCVPEVVQFDRGRVGGMRIVQTYDAGVTVDQWATLLPVIRDDRVYRHVFEDCAHWWALAHYCLLALDEIHRLELVHLDIKGDNVCIPYAPANFDPESPDPMLRPVFGQFALIDFAFALVSKESLTTPLPIGWQKEYDYQSPRLLEALERGRDGDLQATRELDWRCDMYSLAAMLKRYLPDDPVPLGDGHAAGWTSERYDAAKGLILRIRAAHDSDSTASRPHAQLVEVTAAQLGEPQLARSLERGWSLARELTVSFAGSPLTPVTRVAPVTRIVTPIQVARTGRVTAVTVVAPPARAQEIEEPAAVAPIGAAADVAKAPAAAALRTHAVPHARRARRAAAALAALALVAVGATLWHRGGGGPTQQDLDEVLAPVRAAAEKVVDAAARLSRREQAPAVVASNAAAPSGAPSTVAPQSLSETRAQPQAPAPARTSPQAQAVQTEPQPGIATPSPAREAVSERSGATGPAMPPQLSRERTSAPANASAAALGDAASGAGARASAPGDATVAATQDHSPAHASSPWRAPAKPAVKASRASSHAPPVAAGVPPANQARAPTAQTRAYAAWASLQPPAWVASRSHSPGNPPGFKAQEQDAGATVTSPRTAPGETPALAGATTAASVATGDASRQSAAPTSIADSPRQSAVTPVSAADAAQPPIASAQAATATASPREPQPAPSRAPAGQSLFASRSVAPVEDRSVDAPVPTVPSFGLASRASAPAAQPRPEDPSAQAQRMLADAVPRVARQGELEVSRVLLIAASAYRPAQDRALADAARLARIRDESAISVHATAPAEARRLHNQARMALASGRNGRDALDLELRAFAADPRDPEIAGDLAVHYLKAKPPQAELARQLSLVALTARSSQYSTTRLEDWQTFAAASALTGRESDARNAFFVTLALSANIERTCVSGWNALASYGDRLRGPVDALLYRVHMRGHSVDSPWCAWPPVWSSPPRLAGELVP